MGLNISMQDPSTRAEHPDWDDLRYVGDREFWTNFAGLEFDELRDRGFPYASDYIWYRPRDLAAFRTRAKQLKINSDRWIHAANLLEAEPNYWLYFGY